MNFTRIIHFLLFAFAAVSCNNWSASDRIVEYDPDLQIDNYKSLEYIEGLLAKDDDNEAYLYKKSELLFALNRIDEAENELKKIEDIEDQSWNVKLLFIKINIQREHYEEALILAEKMYMESESSLELKSLLGDLYFHTGAYLKSMDFINQCIDTDVENPDNFFKKGLSSYGLKDTVNALRNFDLALSKGFDHQDGIVTYANLLAEIGEGEQSLELLEEYRNNTADNLKLNLAYANSLISEGMYAEAKEILKQLDSVQFSNPAVYKYLGEISFKSNQYDSSVFYAEQVLLLDSNYVEGYYQLGKSLRAKNQVYNALNTYREGLKRFPSDPIMLEESDKLVKYIAYLQRSRREYEERLVLPMMKSKTVDN